MHEISQKARQIRDVIRYLKVFKNAVTVIYIDDEIINSPMLPSHIHDISLIHESGINVVIVPVIYVYMQFETIQIAYIFLKK